MPESVHARIEERLAMSPGPWIDVAAGVGFSNSWANNGGVFGNVEYCLIGDWVHLRGAMTAGTMGATAFTLPAGYRPANREALIATGSGNGLCRILIDTDGTVDPQNLFSATNSFVSLTGLAFSTAS